jgi:hypothetical protein
MPVDPVDFTEDELRDDARPSKDADEDHWEVGCQSCSRCGSFCTSTEKHQYYSGVWSAGCPEMLWAEILTCSACGNVEEL